MTHRKHAAALLTAVLLLALTACTAAQTSVPAASPAPTADT